MLIEGSKTLAAPRAAVWKALNDPELLRLTIPGCREVAELAPGKLEIGLSAAVGPIKTSFNVELDKLDVVELESYTLRGKGSAGAAGSASGAVRVALSDIDQGTLLTYAAETEISGKVAQLGARLIDAAARRFSEEFFANIARRLGPAATAGASPTPSASSARAVPAPHEPAAATALSRLAWKLALGCGVGSFLGSLAASWIH